MDEGYNKDVKQLIRLRQERPSFARLISWEFSKASEEGNQRKSKKKIKKQNKKASIVDDGDSITTKTDDDVEDEEKVDDDNSSELSGESEYDTAPEDDINELSDRLGASLGASASSMDRGYEADMTDFSNRLGDSVSTTDTFKTVFSQSTEGYGENNDDEIDSVDDNDDDDDDSNAMITTGCSAVHNEGRTRRRSKRQKKKRAEMTRLVFANELLHLLNLFDAEDDIDNVFEEIKENPATVEVNRRIPSLVELCMKASRRKTRTSSSNRSSSASQILPYGIKRLLTSLGHDQKMLSKQLSYLQNHILPRISTDDPTGRRFKFPLRSVWSCWPFPVVDQHGYGGLDALLQSTKTPAFLYSPLMHKLYDLLMSVNLIGDNFSYYTYHIAQSPCALSAFAVTIDLMLPSSMRDIGRFSKKTQEEGVLSKTFQTMVIRTKTALRARYPKLVNEFFDKVIPYVMWARGNIAIATEMFHFLIKNEPKSRKKAMYLSEIARMLQQFGDEDGACKFYQVATDVAVMAKKVTDKGLQEVREQTEVLLANIYDTGVLDSTKSQLSRSHWNYAMGMAERKPETVLAGIESQLCFHGYHSEDWLTTVLAKITAHSVNVPSLLLHQSMVYAMMGSESDSRRSFREFRMRNNDQVGHQVLSFIGPQEKNLWKPLVEMVNTQKYVGVKPLQVVWRTQLLPPILSNQRPMEAHLNSRELNLHINEMGHLTGDMQMFLPPLRDITLDPYTGSLVINNCPSFIGEWKSAYLHSSRFYSGLMLLPTPMCIHAQEDGTRVHLLMFGHRSISLDYHYDFKIATMVLYWTGSTGHVAKVNLLNLIKDYIRKEVQKKIEDNKMALKNHKSTMDIYDLMLKVLEESYKKNLSMDYNTVLSTAEKRFRDEQARKKALEKDVKEKTKKKDTQRLKPHIHIYLLNISIEESPISFGKTVVLPLRIYNGNAGRDTLVFIRTDDKAHFQDIKIVTLMAGVTSGTIVRQCYSEDEEFFCAISRKDGNPYVNLYNEFGTMVERFDVSTLGSDDYQTEDSDFCVVGLYLFGINKDRTSVWKHMIGVETDENDLETGVTWAIVQYWSDLSQSGAKNEVKHLKTVGRTVIGKLLLLHLSVGLGFMDPVTMQFVAMETTESTSTENLTEDKNILIGDFYIVKILTEKLFNKDGTQVCRTMLAINNTVLEMDISKEPGSETKSVKLIQRVYLPGIPKEVCLVGKAAGFLISLTLHSNEEDHNYNEHVFYFNNEGQLQGVLPFLAKGPRSFHAAYLHDNSGKDEGQSSSKAGWYVYMRDGKGGILGVKLHR